MENGKNFKFFPESPLPAAGSSRSGDLPAYLSNPGSRILATGRAEKFFLSLPTTPHFEICQTKFLSHLLLQSEQGKMAGNGAIEIFNAVFACFLAFLRMSNTLSKKLSVTIFFMQYPPC